MILILSDVPGIKKSDEMSTGRHQMGVIGASHRLMNCRITRNGIDAPTNSYGRIMNGTMSTGNIGKVQVR